MIFKVTVRYYCRNSAQLPSYQCAVFKIILNKYGKRLRGYVLTWVIIPFSFAVLIYITMQKQYDISTFEGKQRVVEDYRKAVQANPGLKFKKFCTQCGIDRYEPLLWWCHRHGISVLDIIRGSQTESGNLNPTFIQFRPGQAPTAIVLKDISITFPDGINLTLRESCVDDLVTLLDTYKTRHCGEGDAGICSH